MSTHDPNLTRNQKLALDSFRQRKYFHAADRVLWAYIQERRKASMRYLTQEQEVNIAKNELKRIPNWKWKGMHELFVVMLRAIYNHGLLLAGPGQGWRVPLNDEEEALAGCQAVTRAAGHFKRQEDAIRRLSARKQGYAPKSALGKKAYSTQRQPTLDVIDGFTDLREHHQARVRALSDAVNLREAQRSVPCRAYRPLSEWQERATESKKRFLNGSK